MSSSSKVIMEERQFLQEDYFVPVDFVGEVNSRGDYFVLCEAKEGRLVKKIGFFLDPLYKWIQGIQVTYTDDKESPILGTTSGSYKELGLESGETIKQASIWKETSAHGHEIAGIEFKTSEGVTFDVGVESGKEKSHQVPVGSGYLAGLTGSCIKNRFRPSSASFAFAFDKLGFIFLKQIKSAVISDVKLISEPGPEAIRLEQLAYSDFENINSEEADYDFTNDVSRTSSFSFSSTTSKQFPKSLKIEIGIPKMARFGGEFGWTKGATETLGWTKENATKLSWTMKGKVKPGQVVHCLATCQRGEVDVDFKAKVTLKFIGTSHQLTYDETGTLHNTTYAYSTARATAESLVSGTQPTIGESKPESAESLRASMDKIMDLIAMNKEEGLRFLQDSLKDQHSKELAYKQAEMEYREKADEKRLQWEKEKQEAEKHIATERTRQAIIEAYSKTGNDALLKLLSC